MPPTSVGGIFRVGRGVAAGALRLGLLRGGFATSQAIPDHIFRPTEKAFFKHINNNLYKDMQINLLQRFHHPECPPRLSGRLVYCIASIKNTFRPGTLESEAWRKFSSQIYDNYLKPQEFNENYCNKIYD